MSDCEQLTAMTKADYEGGVDSAVVAVGPEHETYKYNYSYKPDSRSEECYTKDGFYLDDPDSYAGYITDEERSEFVEAYQAVEQLRRVKPTALPESVEDAIFDMLIKLGINL